MCGWWRGTCIWWFLDNDCQLLLSLFNDLLKCTCSYCSVCHLRFPKVVLAHILGEVDTSCVVLWSVFSTTCLPIFISLLHILRKQSKKTVDVFFESLCTSIYVQCIMKVVYTVMYINLPAMLMFQYLLFRLSYVRSMSDHDGHSIVSLSVSTTSGDIVSTSHQGLLFILSCHSLSVEMIYVVYTMHVIQCRCQWAVLLCHYKVLLVF